jgi:hypothetical protein
MNALLLFLVLCCAGWRGLYPRAQPRTKGGVVTDLRVVLINPKDSAPGTRKQIKARIIVASAIPKRHALTRRPKVARRDGPDKPVRRAFLSPQIYLPAALRIVGQVILFACRPPLSPDRRGLQDTSPHPAQARRRPVGALDGLNLKNDIPTCR